MMSKQYSSALHCFKTRHHPDFTWVRRNSHGSCAFRHWRSGCFAFELFLTGANLDLSRKVLFGYLALECIQSSLLTARQVFLHFFSRVLSTEPKCQLPPFSPSPYCTVMESPFWIAANSSDVNVNVTMLVEPSSPSRLMSNC